MIGRNPIVKNSKKITVVRNCKKKRNHLLSMTSMTMFTQSQNPSNAAFTHSGFDDQERNLTFVKTAFQVL